MSVDTSDRPLSSGQERRLREYLEDRFLLITRALSKRSDPHSPTRTLTSYLTAMQPLMALILTIPPIDPSASLRTTFLLRFTNDLLESIPSFPLVDPPPLIDEDHDADPLPPLDITLVQLFETITELDKGWKAVLSSQRWDPVTKTAGESHISTRGVSITDKIRLNSLVLSRKEIIIDWLESGQVDLSTEHREEFAHMFWRTLGELANQE